MHRNLMRASALALALFALGACTDDATSPMDVEDVETALLGVVPPGGSTDVDPNEPVVIRFDHPIGLHMTEYAELRDGDADGPVVAGAWTLSTDQTALTFTPTQPLKPLATYVLHLGGGMLDQHGGNLNFERHGFEYGGEWCTEQQAGMGPGGPMGRMGTQHGHNQDWRHPNGTYGMFFTFTTSG